jgi:hypothetical protein
MPIHVQCPNCGQSVEVPDSLGGRVSRCSDCGWDLPVPQTGGSPYLDPIGVLFNKDGQPISRGKARRDATTGFVTLRDSVAQFLIRCSIAALLVAFICAPILALLWLVLAAFRTHF